MTDSGPPSLTPLQVPRRPSTSSQDPSLRKHTLTPFACGLITLTCQLAPLVHTQTSQGVGYLVKDSQA